MAINIQFKPKLVALITKVSTVISDIKTAVTTVISTVRTTISTATSLFENPNMNDIEAAIKTVQKKEEVSKTSDLIGKIIGKIKSYLSAVGDLKTKIMGSAVIIVLKKLQSLIQTLPGTIDKAKKEARAKAKSTTESAKESLVNNVEINKEGVTIPSPSDIGSIISDITTSIVTAVTQAISIIIGFITGG